MCIRDSLRPRGKKRKWHPRGRSWDALGALLEPLRCFWGLPRIPQEDPRGAKRPQRGAQERIPTVYELWGALLGSSCGLLGCSWGLLASALGTKQGSYTVGIRSRGPQEYPKRTQDESRGPKEEPKSESPPVLGILGLLWGALGAIRAS